MCAYPRAPPDPSPTATRRPSTMRQPYVDFPSVTSTPAPTTVRPAHAWGIATLTDTENSRDTVLDIWFPAPALGAAPSDSAAPTELTALVGSDAVRGVRREVRLVEIADLDQAPVSAEDAWLRLH